MRRHALDNIAQVDERIDLQVLARLHQRTQDGGPVRRRFAAREQMIFAAQNNRSERLFRAVMPRPGLCRVGAGQRSGAGVYGPQVFTDAA